MTIAVVLAAAVVLGSLRLLLGQRKACLSRAHIGLRLVLQPLLALALYFTLFPPEQPFDGSPATLTVLTENWQQAAGAHAIDPAQTIALPEATDAAHVTAVPDLATALRRHPNAADLHILGAGLDPRDHDAARGRVTRFDPASLPTGVIELNVPTATLPGQRVTVTGSTHGIANGTVTLLDPAGTSIARAILDHDGRFTLHTVARGPGASLHVLEITDGDGQPVQSLDVALLTHAAGQPRVLLLAGAPNPELKYLRRWALDAGIDLASRVQLTERIPQRRGTPALDAAALQAFDLVILDERAWHGLGSGERTLLVDAVRGGLGLLLRLTSDPTAAERTALGTLGFDVRTVDISRTVTLEPNIAPIARTPAAVSDDPAIGTPQPTAASLSRRPLQVSAPDATPMLSAGDGTALALWRPHGQGRIALWWLSDSYRLVMAGDAAAHGSLWSSAVATVARPRGPIQPRAHPSAPQVGDRVTACNLTAGATAVAPDLSRAGLLVDKTTGCAGYWPADPGTHRIESADAGTHWIQVQAADHAPALAAAAQRIATRQLLEHPPVARIGPSSLGATQRAATWPFLLAWLLLFALLGWLERRRG